MSDYSTYTERRSASETTIECSKLDINNNFFLWGDLEISQIVCH